MATGGRGGPNLLGLCCLPARGWCCAGVWPPSWWGLLRWCVPPPHGKARCVRGRPPPTVGRAVSLCGPCHGGACCAGVWPASWSAVLRCCLAPLMVGRALLVRGCPHGGACFVTACPPGWLYVVWSCLAWVVVVRAAWRPASLGSGWWCLWWCSSMRHARLVLFVRCCLCRLTVGVFGWMWLVVGLRLWFSDHLAGVGSVLLRCPPHGAACCVGACPPPWWGVLCWCVAPPIVGRAALLCACPHGGARCVGAWPPSWWGVLC